MPDRSAALGIVCGIETEVLKNSGQHLLSAQRVKKAKTVIASHRRWRGNPLKFEYSQHIPADSHAKTTLCFLRENDTGGVTVSNDHRLFGGCFYYPIFFGDISSLFS